MMEKNLIKQILIDRGLYKDDYFNQSLYKISDSVMLKKDSEYALSMGYSTLQNMHNINHVGLKEILENFTLKQDEEIKIISINPIKEPTIPPTDIGDIIRIYFNPSMDFLYGVYKKPTDEEIKRRHIDEYKELVIANKDTKSTEQIVQLLYDNNASQIDSVAALIYGLNISLSEADSIVLNSQTWSHMREETDRIRAIFFSKDSDEG